MTIKGIQLYSIAFCCVLLHQQNISIYVEDGLRDPKALGVGSSDHSNKNKLKQ